MKLLDGVRAESVTSEDGQYRFRLERVWNSNLPLLTWIGLHPTPAEADEDDRLLRKLQALSRRWGYGGIAVVNLFALRCRYPWELRQHVAPIGRFNDGHIIQSCRDRRSRAAVAGWGNVGRLNGRSAAVRANLAAGGVRLWRMGGPLTRFGEPWTPTRLPYDTIAVPWTDVQQPTMEGEADGSERV